MTKTSLKKPIFIFIYALILTTGAMFFIPCFVQLQSSLNSEFLVRGKSLAQKLALESQTPLKTMTREKLYGLVDSLMKESDVSSAAVMDADNNVVVQNGASDNEQLRAQGAGGKIGEEVEVKKIRLPDGQKAYALLSGVYSREEAGGAGVSDELAMLGMTGGSIGEGKDESVRKKYLGFVQVTMSLKRLHAIQRKLELQLLAIFVLVLLAGTAGGRYFAGFVLLPVNQLVAAMKDIASRKGDLTQRISISREDELGELAYWFNQFVDNVRQIVGNTIALVDQMTSALSELSSTAEELNATADEINTTVQGFTHDLQKQEDETTSATTLLNQVTGTLLDITQQAEGSSRLFEETKDISRHGNETVQQSVHKINGIAENMSVIEERMRHLSGSLNDISGFVETIQGIASQTNLLSLNAAIEAARAGEAGRGFSVVAEEVRKLAESSAGASQQIQTLISQIQTETHETSEATREGAQAVQTGRETIHQAGVSLEAVMKTANQSASISTDISKALLQQSDILKTMIQRVLNVQALGKNNFIAAQTMAASVEEQTASLDQVTTAVQRLAEDACKVKDLVIEFKVK